MVLLKNRLISLIFFVALFSLIFSTVAPSVVCFNESSQKNQTMEYYSYDQLTDLMEELHTKNPNIFSFYSIGKTYEGRDLWVGQITNISSVETEKPEVLYYGGIHGNEPLGYQAVIYSMKSIVENYSTPYVNQSFTNRIKTIVDSTILYFIPMMNPDGIEAGSRKNRQPNQCLFGNTLFKGVDLNRNFPYEWDAFDQHPFQYRYGRFNLQDFLKQPIRFLLRNFPLCFFPTTVKYPMLDLESLVPLLHGGHYRGPEPLSENETQAFSTFIDDHQIRMSIDYHSSGKKILYPWGWTKDNAPDEPLFLSVAANISKINGYDILQSADWYYTPGCDMDWLYADHKILPFTIEVGSLKQPSEFVFQDSIEETCKTHVLVNLYLAEQVHLINQSIID